MSINLQTNYLFNLYLHFIEYLQFKVNMEI